MLTATILGFLLAVAPVSADQNTSNHQAMVMGFDQEKTTHHFRLYTDGGAIEIGVIDPADATDRDAIRSHLPHIAEMFSEGNFEAPMLVHDSANVPGTKELATKRRVVRYRYEETLEGGRVVINTTDADALAAVHAFLRYQIIEHRTGDTTVPQKR